MTSDNFAQCVEHINVLTLRLKNADERCSLLSANLRRVKAECASQHSSSVPPPPPLLLTTMMKGGAGSISGSMSLPTAGSVTPPVLQKTKSTRAPYTPRLLFEHSFAFFFHLASTDSPLLVFSSRTKKWDCSKWILLKRPPIAKALIPENRVLLNHRILYICLSDECGRRSPCTLKVHRSRFLLLAVWIQVKVCSSTTELLFIYLLVPYYSCYSLFTSLW